MIFDKTHVQVPLLYFGGFPLTCSFSLSFEVLERKKNQRTRGGPVHSKKYVHFLWSTFYYGQLATMSLTEWFGDREILITGVTSRLGHSLLEKLLRTFPNVKIHLIVTSHDNLLPTDQIKKIFDSPG